MFGQSPTPQAASSVMPPWAPPPQNVATTPIATTRPSPTPAATTTAISAPVTSSGGYHYIHAYPITDIYTHPPHY